MGFLPGGGVVFHKGAGLWILLPQGLQCLGQICQLRGEGVIGGRGVGGRCAHIPKGQMGGQMEQHSGEQQQEQHPADKPGHPPLPAAALLSAGTEIGDGGNHMITPCTGLSR